MQKPDFGHRVTKLNYTTIRSSLSLQKFLWPNMLKCQKPADFQESNYEEVGATLLHVIINYEVSLAQISPKR